MISSKVNSLKAYAQTSWLGPEGNNSRESRETSGLGRESKLTEVVLRSGYILI